MMGKKWDYRCCEGTVYVASWIWRNVCEWLGKASSSALGLFLTMGLTLKVPYYAKYNGRWYLARCTRIDLKIMQIEIANRKHVSYVEISHKKGFHTCWRRILSIMREFLFFFSKRHCDIKIQSGREMQLYTKTSEMREFPETLASIGKLKRGGVTEKQSLYKTGDK